MWLELIKDFFADLKTHRTRATLTLVAVTWGTAAVVLLLAFGEGLGNQLMNGFLNAGNRIMILYAGETGKPWEGVPKGRRIHLVEEDAIILKQAIPLIADISPGYMDNVTLTFGKKTSTTTCEGVNASFEEMRRMYPAAGGRFLNTLDVGAQRRVLVLGAKIAKDVFGDVNPVGQTVLVDKSPFTVVGVLQDKIQTSMNNGPDSYRAIMPYSTFRTMYGAKNVGSLTVLPADVSKQEELKREIFRVLARKYNFDPTDERTLFIWDFIEGEKMIGKVNLGIAMFLGSVGFLTLLIAGVGVANVMYVVVKERTREIGVKMALGARRMYILAQVIFEALLLCFLGGLFGMLISWGIVSIVGLFPSDSGVMQFLGRPSLSTGIMVTTTGVLTVLGLLAGFFPARRAATVDPVESLRYE
jgi:putative ABC transport system permease protein